MKNRTAFFAMLAMTMAALVLTGCRTPRLGDGFRNGIPEATFRNQGPDIDVNWGAEDGAWTSLDHSMQTGTGSATERRWEGVAVYFAYDRATVGASERPKVEALAEFLTANSGYYVIIEGHCDERGSDEYNRALGERRALAVGDYLASLGIAGDRIRTLSYGEERPAVPDATVEAQHAKNRRCEFIFGIE